MMGDGVLTKDVFIAYTVGQGANVVNAIKALGVIVVLCCAHRLNTVVVVWMLGIGGTVNTCRSKPMEVLMTKLAACVGKFSHSDVNSSELKVLQELVTQFSKIYEQLIRRISTLLDPWRKTLSKQKCVNGSPDVKQLAINELKDVADLFEGSAPQQTTVPAASASAPAPAPASALAPAPAPPPAPVPGGHGATGPRGHWQRSRGCSPLRSGDAPTHWLPLGVRVPLEMSRRAARGQASRTRYAFSKS